MPPDRLPADLTFSWRYTLPPRSSVPQLYHDTAFCLDMPDVLATGYLVGMMELACIHGLMPYLDWPREQSVGVHVSFSHIAASCAGMTLQIEGRLLQVEGRRLRFALSARDDLELVSEGVHERMLIYPDKFNARLAQKQQRWQGESR
ncbi:thioesterase family protein [Massilia sp. W12]|uniref:thioesterase family protein n=1 Tax=Massilia sp. W12 TaxID=3126507 RepID=UPI0030CF9257